MSTEIVDAHIHLYRTSDQGHREKEEYEIWEYGEKDVPLIIGGNALEFLA
ncbi:MAG: hypothetical protein NWE88_02860 [Candidatus Bathyarchaeota archaeon]|nr:hypothetical protein [Candidatus Bathyarchaeota archaeon]